MDPKLISYLYLAVAIGAEVTGTLALRASEGFSRPVASLIVVAGYGTAFYCLSMTLKTVPVSMAYAIWSGVGIALIALVSWLMRGEKLDLPALIGMGLILAGVLVLTLLSKAEVR